VERFLSRTSARTKTSTIVVRSPSSMRNGSGHEGVLAKLDLHRVEEFDDHDGEQTRSSRSMIGPGMLPPRR
jgi:hypothetical protein